MDVIRHLRSAREHITFSRYATLWLFVICIHCILQVTLQAITLADNATAEHVVDVCLQEAGIAKGFMIIRDNSLQQCDGIPGLASTTCQIISTAQNDLVHTYSQRDPDQSTMLSLTLPNGTHMTTSSQCVHSLSWLEDIFHDAKTEDIVTLCFQLWLFAVSLWAILNDSIPHLAVGVAGHVLDSAWAGFRIKFTMSLHEDYEKYIVRGACDGADILGDWWDVRLSHAIPIAVCNSVVLAAILYLSWMLFWAFVKQTFSRVGASPIINRAHKIALCFEAEVELGAFFALASTAMWIDRISDGVFGKDVEMYQILFIVTVVALPLWVLAGWISIRREIKWLFVCFLLLQSFLLAVWPASLASALYRYELVTSSFFSCMLIISFVFLVFTAITALICRFNFGRGLAHFREVQAVLDSADFTPGYFAYDSTTESDLYLMDPEKVGDYELAREEDHRQDPNNGLRREPFLKFNSPLNWLNNPAHTQNEKNRVDSSPYRLSMLWEPKFKLPIQPIPAVLSPGARNPTPSVFTQSSAESPGIITFASRSPQSSATARTVSISRGPKTIYVMP
jgi:hypothetical protein